MNTGPNLQKPKSPEQQYIAAVANLAASITALVEGMNAITEKIDDLSNEVAVLSDYAIRKGRQEKLFAPDEYKDDSDEPAKGS